MIIVITERGRYWNNCLNTDSHKIVFLTVWTINRRPQSHRYPFSHGAGPPAQFISSIADNVQGPLPSSCAALWITPRAAVSGTLLSHSITRSTPPTWQDKQRGGGSVALSKPPITHEWTPNFSLGGRRRTPLTHTHTQILVAGHRKETQVQPPKVRLCRFRERNVNDQPVQVTHSWRWLTDSCWKTLKLHLSNIAP